MPAPVNVYTPSVATAVTDGGATEKVVLTSGPINTDTVQKTVTLAGFLVVTPGTAATAVVVKLRRGSSTSGTQVGDTVTVFCTAGDALPVPFTFSDEPGESAGVTYSVTVTETAATADGTVNVVALSAVVSQ